MGMDILILNTGVVDLRRADFEFADKLVGEGGLTTCKTEQVPDYSQEQFSEWIEEGCATAGGPGNSAPLIARAGLKVAVGVNLGCGNYDGLDAQGRFFYDVMTDNGVDMSATYIHPHLPTGTTYIHHRPGQERGGIAYVAGANDDFDFETFKAAVDRLRPGIVYYMYCGLSRRGDANRGRDLAEFIRWCADKEIVTIADTSTLADNPRKLIQAGDAVEQYSLLEPVLPEVDVFFTSSDEAGMIENTLSRPRNRSAFEEDENSRHFLDFLAGRFWKEDGRTRIFGVTVSNGAYEKHMCPDGVRHGPHKVESRFAAGEVIDLVGAGDSFRAGLISYIARNLQRFKNGSLDFCEAVQMGNLFAALYIMAPLDNRYGNIGPYEKILKVVHGGTGYGNFAQLLNAVKR
ncbi:MAG: carbohydrate kinase family protein [Planctomycetota bacterium]|jgi:sugar/nucleoside kinase (ribokinase family)